VKVVVAEGVQSLWFKGHAAQTSRTTLKWVSRTRIVGGGWESGWRQGDEG
jgi:hypothetical protein